jgi:hypothetical protein
VVRLCVKGWKKEPGMNAQLYTLLDVTRLPTGGWTKFLRTTSVKTNRFEPDRCAVAYFSANAYLLSHPRGSVLRGERPAEVSASELKVAPSVVALPANTERSSDILTSQGASLLSFNDP